MNKETDEAKWEARIEMRVAMLERIAKWAGGAVIGGLSYLSYLYLQGAGVLP